MQPTAATNATVGGILPQGVIAASIPGRLRLRHPLLRQSQRSDALAARLRTLDGMLTVEANTVAGSLLLRYDPLRSEPATIAAAVAATMATEFVAAPEFGQSPATAEERPATGRRAAREWNRLAKLGMLASLPVSLALAATGSKRLHAATGGVFSLLLLVHLVVHRRHLIK